MILTASGRRLHSDRKSSSSLVAKNQPSHLHSSCDWILEETKRDSCRCSICFDNTQDLLTRVGKVKHLQVHGSILVQLMSQVGGTNHPRKIYSIQMHWSRVPWFYLATDIPDTWSFTWLDGSVEKVRLFCSGSFSLFLLLLSLTASALTL